MRVAHRVLRSAAAAGAVLLAAACVVPPPGVGPRPTELADAAPDVSLYSFDQSAGSVGSGTLSYSVTRDAYAAAFEVDRRGYVRVLSPTGTRDSTRVAAGRSYVVYPEYHTTDPEYANYSSDYSRIPFVFVVTADEPLDLSMFAQGGRLSRALRATDADNPDSTTAAVARLVARNSIAYGADYAYVAPRIYGQARTFVAECARPVEDVHDYQYYRQLWAVFTPYDPLLSPALTFSFEPALGWSSFYGRNAYLPYAAYRAQLANAAFYDGCDGAATYQSYAYGGYGLPGVYGLNYGYPYGYGYGYGYPYGYGYGYPVGVATAPTGIKHRPSPFSLPRTPVSIGGTQVAGTRPSGAPSHLGWQAFGAHRGPGEAQPMTPSLLGVERLGPERLGLRHPVERLGIERLGFGMHPAAGTTPSHVTVMRPYAEPRFGQGWGGGPGMPRTSAYGAGAYGAAAYGGGMHHAAFGASAGSHVSAPSASPVSSGSAGAAAVQAHSEAKSGH